MLRRFLNRTAFSRFIHHLQRGLRISLYCLLAIFILAKSNLSLTEETERVRAYTREIEFDYISWTANAIGIKLGQVALKTDTYLAQEGQKQLVKDYLELLQRIFQVEDEVRQVYSDPYVPDPLNATRTQRLELESLDARRTNLEPLAEAVLQEQISLAATHLGLTLAGQPIPPVLFHITPPPDALIVSPREVIRQDADISILPGLQIEKITALEDTVDRSLKVSSLVVPTGGVGVYPTMVMQTTDLNWLVVVVAHEWTHNILTLRPLGISYMASPEMRIMNETTASIAGNEIGSKVIELFYPELLPPPTSPTPSTASPDVPADQAVFSFQKEMHLTRITVDQLLKEGKIEEAESYMEERRRFLWDHGYRIRKLNQAFFAFYGAYADQAVGAAGADPVGAAVRALRAGSASLEEFINRISRMWSFDQLQAEVQTITPK